MKKILLVILGMFLLGFALNEIAGVKFPIGSTMLHDTSASVLTINKNVKINGYMQSNGTVINGGEVVRDKLVRLPISSLSTWNSVDHGITDYRKIISVDCIIIEDTTGQYLPLGYNAGGGFNTGTVAKVQTTKCWYIAVSPAASYRLLDDTVLFKISYKE